MNGILKKEIEKESFGEEIQERKSKFEEERDWESKKN